MALLPRASTLTSLAVVLGLGCGGSEASPVAQPATVRPSPGDEVAGATGGGSGVALADDPRLRFMPAATNWVLRVDVASVRGASFEAQLRERFGLERLSEFGPPEAMRRVDGLFVGGEHDEAGAAVLTGDLADVRGAMEAHLTSAVGLAPGVVGGRDALVSERFKFVFYDDHTWIIWGGFDDPFAARPEERAVLAALPGFTERMVAAGQSDPPLVEYFVADGEDELADLTLLVRVSCASCAQSLAYDAVVRYPDAQQATQHADNLTNMLRSLAEESNDAEEMGLEPDGSWIRVQGNELQLHQLMSKPSVAFSNGVEYLFLISVTLHPPDFSH